MSCAIKAKSAWARAGIAARLLTTVKPWEFGGGGLCRSFDNCFEMGDGDEVFALLLAKASTNDNLRTAMRRHGQDRLADRAETLREMIR